MRNHSVPCIPSPVWCEPLTHDVSSSQEGLIGGGQGCEAVSRVKDGKLIFVSNVTFGARTGGGVGRELPLLYDWSAKYIGKRKGTRLKSRLHPYERDLTGPAPGSFSLDVRVRMLLL